MTDLYETITNKLIETIEKGALPWRKLLERDNELEL